MEDNLCKFIEILTPEETEKNRYRGKSQDLGFRSVFGGQLIGQGLAAANSTVKKSRSVHSLHAYFLRPGNPGSSIEYAVDRIRDGTSFTMRRVVAYQKGKPIFNMSASFQRDEEGVDHQETMPEVRGPEELPPEYESWQKIKHLIPERVRDLFTKKKVIEFRPVTAIDYLSPKRLPPVQDVWLKVIEPMPDDRALHRAVLAYISDFKLLGTALLPHGLTFFHPGTEIASLDHALWFHRDFRIDDWLLYSMYSPSASASRGFNRGNFFTREGKLVASVSQEGLIRNR